MAAMAASQSQIFRRKIYYVLDDEHSQLRLHDGESDRILRDFEDSIYDIFPTPDDRILVYADRKLHVVDDAGVAEEIVDDVFDVTAYSPQGLLSFIGNDTRSYLLNTKTFTLTDVTIARREYHEPSMTDITDTVILSASYPASDGVVSSRGWEIKTGRCFNENRWFPPYVFLLSDKDIVALDTRTEEYITLLEKDASNSFMYDSFIHYNDNTLALLGLTASGNPTVRLYDNIPYDASNFVEDTIVTPDQYVFIQKEKGKYEYYDLKDPLTVRTVQFPGKAWRVATVEDNSMAVALLGGGVLASLIARYL